MQKEKKGQIPETKLFKLSKAEELYGIPRRTLRRCCITKKITINGVECPFIGIKIGKDWFVAQKELKKHLTEVEDGCKRV